LNPVQAAVLRAEHELASRSNALAHCMRSHRDAAHPSCAPQRRAVQQAAARLARLRESSTRTGGGAGGDRSAARHTPVIIGTNDGAGWGAEAAHTILAGHVTWNRVEIGTPSNTVAESLSDGFHVLAIVGNYMSDETPISSIDPNTWASTIVSELKANPGITIAEAGNEMYFKGNVANPSQYGRMYLAAVNALRAAGIHTPLLFDMEGVIPTGGTWSSHTGWSEVNGWLRGAVNAVPGLASAILENGVGAHPYGASQENWGDSIGVKAIAAQESVERSVLGAIPPTYITEYGVDLGGCGKPYGACSQTEQATKLTAAFKAFEADPHVYGIWTYQSHDDSSGQWGYMNNDGSTRPAFAALSAAAVEQGQ
jgi:hypothetical protein